MKNKNYISQQGGFSPLGFTLIELMVVISIMAILLTMGFTQFAHYKTKQQVRNSVKILTQTLTNARNSAIYGMATSSGNLDIGVLLKENNNKIKIMGYAFSDSNPPADYSADKYILEEIPLEKNIEFSSSGGLILYKAITGSGIYKNFTIDSDNKIEMGVGLKGATSGFFSRKIKYYTKTYISDVE